MINKPDKVPPACPSDTGAQNPLGPIRHVPFLLRFISPHQIKQVDPGETIYTRVQRETTDDR